MSVSIVSVAVPVRIMSITVSITMSGSIVSITVSVRIMSIIMLGCVYLS